MALAASLGTWLVTALGAAVVIFFRNPPRGALNMMLGFSAGVMLAASVWSLLLPSMEQARALLRVPAWLVAGLGLLAGAGFLWGTDKLIAACAGANASRQAKRGKPAEKKGARGRAWLLIFSITLHNIPEGLAVGVAFGGLAALAGGASPEALMGAVSVSVGIGIQDFPEGAAVSLPLRQGGMNRGRAFFWGQASGLVEPIAAMVGAALAMGVRQLLPWLLAFSAGAMILVCTHELIPASHEGDGEVLSYAPTIGLILGFVLMMGLDVALG
ncbi:MAG: ZIP family metal transporter [Oscillospiraceae bacterium]|jgi:ZIP family zinc transporter|nr:ZIP family metal transporter [Oscillospiraceae bacterium]